MEEISHGYPDITYILHRSDKNSPYPSSILASVTHIILIQRNLAATAQRSCRNNQTVLSARYIKVTAYPYRDAAQTSIKAR